MHNNMWCCNRTLHVNLYLVSLWSDVVVSVWTPWEVCLFVCIGVCLWHCATCGRNRLHVSSELSRSKGHLVSTEIFIALLSFVLYYIVCPAFSMPVPISSNPTQPSLCLYPFQLTQPNFLCACTQFTSTVTRQIRSTSAAYNWILSL
jgi:hypothetical protein